MVVERSERNVDQGSESLSLQFVKGGHQGGPTAQHSRQRRVIPPARASMFIRKESRQNIQHKECSICGCEASELDPVAIELAKHRRRI